MIQLLVLIFYTDHRHHYPPSPPHHNHHQAPQSPSSNINEANKMFCLSFNNVRFVYWLNPLSFVEHVRIQIIRSPDTGFHLSNSRQQGQQQPKIGFVSNYRTVVQLSNIINYVDRQLIIGELVDSLNTEWNRRTSFWGGFHFASRSNPI